MDEIEKIFGAALDGEAEGPSASSPDVGSPVGPGDGVSGVPTTEPMTRLASFVTDTFRRNAEYRRNAGVDERLRDALLAQTCRYTPEQEEKLRRAGVPKAVYAPITATKVRAAKAMLCDIFQTSGEWPFTLSPTPDPEVAKEVESEAMLAVGSELSLLMSRLGAMGVESLPEPMMAELQATVAGFAANRYDEMFNRRQRHAQIRARRMERRVQDIMAEGGWVDAFQEYVDYICTYGTGVILGPIPRVRAVNRFREGRLGERKCVREYRMIPTYEAVNPVDCYPAPDAKSADDGPLCIRVKFQPNELKAYVDANGGRSPDGMREGWNVSTIESILARHPHGGVKIWDERPDSSVKEAENKAADDCSDCTMEGIRCFASVRGSVLVDFGITSTRDGKRIEHSRFYGVEVIVLDGYVVYCRIIDDRLGRPVSKGVFYEIPGSWWGESVSSKCAMVQSVMNNCIKALMQNMAVASGPMYWINDVQRLVDKSPNAMKLSPHKVIPFTASMAGNQGAPFGVVSVPSNASELLAVFDKMRLQADDDSGIPAYTYGQSSGQGALRTASGLAIFSEAASRGMKMVIGTTDRLVTRDQVKKTATWVFLYEDDPNLKGDCEVFPAGVMGKILKAQQDQQRLQFLNMAITNPTLTQLLGPKGIAALLRPSIKDLAINPDDCLPSEERMDELDLISKIQQLSGAMQAQAPAQGADVPPEAAEGAPEAPAVEGAETAGGVEERRSVA